MTYLGRPLALVTALACSVLLPPSGVAAGTSLVQIGADGPLVNLAAMRHEGELAFVSQGNLYIIDGSASAVHEIPAGSGVPVTHPAFSPDGKWLAYETEGGGAAP